jgi:hypothetical protein
MQSGEVADLEVRSGTGLTPLSVAAAAGEHAALTVLVAHGANINTQADVGGG